MVCAPGQIDIPRALARGLSIVQAHDPFSISLVRLHITEYLELKIGYLWIVVQLLANDNRKSPTMTLT